MLFRSEHYHDKKHGKQVFFVPKLTLYILDEFIIELSLWLLD